MPQFAITITPSADPEVFNNQPERCNLSLVGSLNSIKVATVKPNCALITGYFNLRETLPLGVGSTEVCASACGEDIEVDFFWLPGNLLKRPLARMYVDFYDPPESKRVANVRSVLRLSSYTAGKDALLPKNGALLIETVELPLYNGSQYLTIDDPIQLGCISGAAARYVEDKSHGGHYVGELAHVISVSELLENDDV